MKLTTIALATAFAMSGTFALAQTDTGAHKAMKKGATRGMTTGSASTRRSSPSNDPSAQGIPGAASTSRTGTVEPNAMNNGKN